jgi:hypothetical protein
MLSLSNGNLITSARYLNDYYILIFEPHNNFKLKKVIENLPTKVTSIINLSECQFAYATCNIVTVMDIDENYQCLNSLDFVDQIITIFYFEEHNLLISGHDVCMKIKNLNEDKPIETKTVWGGVKCLIKLPCKYFATLSYTHELIKIWKMRSFCIHVINTELDFHTTMILLKGYRIAVASENRSMRNITIFN